MRHNNSINDGNIIDFKAYIVDANTMNEGKGRATPIKDDEQNVELISGYEKDGWTVITFMRKLNACEYYDRDIQLHGTTVIIYSYSKNNIDGPLNNIDFHGKGVNMYHGIKSINFFDTITKHSDINTYNDNNIKYVDITAKNYVTEADETVYHCTIKKLPKEMDLKHKNYHIIGYEPIFSDIKTKPFLHHMTVSTCPSNSIVKDTDVDRVGRCFDRDINVFPQIFKECRGGRHLAAWLAGGEPFFYDKQYGIPIGIDYSEYLLLEVHYDNPNFITGLIDNSGIRLYYTDTLRDIDVGGIWLGTYWSPQQFLLPYKDNIQYTSICSNKCINNVLSGNEFDEFNVIASSLHAHKAARQMVLRHFRDNKEINVIDLNKNYDFDYQQNIDITTKKIKIKKNDDLILQCNYTTTSRDKMTVGGLGSMEEMCVTWLTIYPMPKKPLWIACMSVYNDDVLNEFYNKGRQQGWIKTTSNQDNNDITKMEFDYNDKKMDTAYEDILNFNNIDQFCSSDLSNNDIKGTNDDSIVVGLPNKVSVEQLGLYPQEIREGICFKPKHFILDINADNSHDTSNLSMNDLVNLLKYNIVYIIGFLLAIFVGFLFCFKRKSNELNQKLIYDEDECLKNIPISDKKI